MRINEGEKQRKIRLMCGKIKRGEKGHTGIQTDRWIYRQIVRQTNRDNKKILSHLIIQKTTIKINS